MGYHFLALFIDLLVPLFIYVMIRKKDEDDIDIFGTRLRVRKNLQLLIHSP